MAYFFFILFVEGGGHLSSINHANLYGGVPREMNPPQNNRVSCCVASRGGKVTVTKVNTASTALCGGTEGLMCAKQKVGRSFVAQNKQISLDNHWKFADF